LDAPTPPPITQKLYPHGMLWRGWSGPTAMTIPKEEQDAAYAAWQAKQS